MASTVLVTGATGFVGRNLVLWLLEKGVTVHAAHRGGAASGPPGLLRHSNLKWFGVGDDSSFEWDSALQDVDTIIHLMGRAHVLDKSERTNQVAFDRVNVEGLRALLDASCKQGVKRLINLGTIGVHGETSGSTPISEASALNPQSIYARSKLTAEQLIPHYVESFDMAAVTLRAPLIYGADARGNLERLMKWISAGYPMPFASVTNKRSLLSIDNLFSAMWFLLDADINGSEAYVISDMGSYALPEIVLALASGMGRKPRLWSFPISVLGRLVKAVGGNSMANGLLGSLEVNCSKLQSELGWIPEESTIAGLEKLGKRNHLGVFV